MSSLHDIQKKFIEQLRSYIKELSKFHDLLSSDDPSNWYQDDLCQTIHKVAGVCLTFNLTEEGHMARFVEKRLLSISSGMEEETKIEIEENRKEALTLLQELINACAEGCELSDKNWGEIEEENNNDMLTPSPHKINEQKENEIHILIADDDPIIRMLAERKLKSVGYKVSVAKDGAMAVKLAKFIKPNLILMDGSMPNMDGMEAAEILNHDPETHDIPIFILTAYDKCDLVRGHHEGMIEEYIEKPFKIETIVSLINKHLK